MTPGAEQNSGSSMDMLEWRHSIDMELKTMRENMHGLRNEVNSLKLNHVEQLSQVRQDMLKGFAALEISLIKVSSGASTWVVAVTGVISAIPSLSLLIYWIVSGKR